VAKKRNQEVIRKIVAGEYSLPQVAEFASHFIHLRGGMKGFAKDLNEEYEASEAGSPNRQRILSLVMDAIKWTNDRTAGADSTGLQSDADIEREMARIMEKLGDQEEAQPEA
jgi:hypothetical protein